MFHQASHHTVRTVRRALAAVLAIGVLFGAGISTATAATASTASAPADAEALVASPLPEVDGRAHTVSYDKSAYLVDGKPLMLYSGEFHYFRLPSPSLWRDVFQKMKAGGFNAVSLYFDWGYHSSKPGQFDFSGIRDVDLLLDMAAEEGLYVIARPGPYINAEVTGGGFPSYLTTTEGETRTDAADYLQYSDEWMSQINSILAHHQVTEGAGSVVLYQVENEYYAWNYDQQNAGSDSYLEHLMSEASNAGITVPMIGNHNGSRSQIVDVDGPDRYPGAVSCTGTDWPRSPDVITNQKQPDGPMSVPEYAAAWYQGWQGADYADCAKNGYGPEFVDVFYKDVLGQGATYVNYYMAYGGTNWGWTNDARNQTSYDYGAGISEGRQLREKYQTNKLIGYFVQAQPDLAEAGDPDHLDQISGEALTEQHRVNPSTGTQYSVVRHSDISRTDNLEARLWAASAGSEFVDDTDGRIEFSDGWNAADKASWAAGDLRQTEHWTGSAATATLAFTGTAIRWFSSSSDNHGAADVYIDGQKVSTVSTRPGSGEANRASHAVFEKTDLPMGAHTIQIRALGEGNVSVDAFGIGQNAYSAPQQSDTRLDVVGRQSLLLTANTHLGDTKLEYSTSQVVTTVRNGDHDLALLHNVQGSAGETLLAFDEEPSVQAPEGVGVHWDPVSKTLRLNYTHSGLVDVVVTPKGSARAIELLFADTATAEQFWVAGTGVARTLVHGGGLVRSASLAGTTLALIGDNASDPNLTVYTGADSVSWNGTPLADASRSGGIVTGRIPTATAVADIPLSDWKHADENPESAPSFDDSAWTVADKTSTYSDRASTSETVLLANEYGFDSGNTWYRGHFTGSADTTGIRLQTPIFQDGGRRTSAAMSVWLNGAFLGSFTDSAGQTFAFPEGAVAQGADNVVSVLTVNMGDTRNHERDRYKEGRGLGGASVIGATPGAVTWRLQGVTGGYDSWADPVRGPQSTGGLYGERNGWSLPGFDDSGWAAAPVTEPLSRAGVDWYRTQVQVDTPADQDTSFAVNFDAPRTTDEKTRVIVFVNGWNIGHYIPTLGPQTSFPVPNGILNTHGANTIAMAVWRLDGEPSALPAVSLKNLGSVTSTLAVEPVESPGFEQLFPAHPVAGQGSTARLSVPAEMPAAEAFDLTATVTTATADDVTLAPVLTLPEGWSADAAPAPAAVSADEPATLVWHVSAPSRRAPVPGEQAKLRATLGDGTVVETSASLTFTALHGADVDLAGVPTSFQSTEWSQIEHGRSAGGSGPADGGPLALTGRTITTGLGMHAPGRAEYALGGQCTSLTAVVGIDAEVPGGSVSFRIEGDGVTIAGPVTVRGGGSSAELSTDALAGVHRLALVADDAGDGNGQDHADWADPILQCGMAPIAVSDLTDETRHGVRVPETAHAGEVISVSLEQADATEYGVFVFSARRDLGTSLVSNDALSVTLPNDLPLGDHRIAVYRADGSLFGWGPVRIVPGAGEGGENPGGGTATPIPDPVDNGGSEPAGGEAQDRTGGVSSRDGSLAHTGGEIAPLVGLAVIAFLAGVVLIRMRRRRAG